MSPDGVGPLLELTVADLALIDRVRLELAPGFTVITGETGAGKSLLIDALGLVLGARADSGLVRHGADLARVEARFARRPEPLVVAREVTAAGRSTARVDGEAVTAGWLAETVGSLVEIHGQHDQQGLLDERVQRDLLDAFGGCGPARTAVAAAVERWRENETALAELAVEPRERLRRLELAEHEAAEIAAARLQVGEAEAIQTRLRAAQHGEVLTRGGAALHELLAGEGNAARETVAGAARQARDLARFDPRFDPLADRLAGTEAELDDIATEVRSLVEGLDHDPADVVRLEERLSEIYSLERRYGDDEGAVIAHGERMAAEAERLRGLEGERARREAEAARRLTAVAQAATVLSAARATAARALSTAVTGVLEELGFERTRFDVGLGRRTAGRGEPAVELDGDAVAFDATGVDQVVFRFAPNVGEPARPLARIASGGELSRVALAIKEVLAAADATPTLVFDEVDAGIGGRSADPVGRSLWTLARDHRVVCVTHLAQIAAHADVHVRIAKRERGGRTITELTRVEGDERVAELAAMLGGPDGGPAATAAAVALLERTTRWRLEAGPGVALAGDPGANDAPAGDAPAVPA